jgi:hypothetical protein
MQPNPNQPFCSSINVMEELVQAEIEKQIQSYPDSLKSYIKAVEVATYALNRLPAFYASSQRGKEQQLKQAHQYREQITQEVRRALAAIQRDPLRLSQPLMSDRDRQLQEADTARQAIVEFLCEQQLVDRKEIGWATLASTVLKSFNIAKWQTWTGEIPNHVHSLPKIPYRKI